MRSRFVVTLIGEDAMRSIVIMLTMFGLTIHAIFGCCVHALCAVPHVAESVEASCSCGEVSRPSSTAFAITSDTDSFTDSLDLPLFTPLSEMTTQLEGVPCGHAFRTVSDHADFHTSCHTHSRCVFPNDGQQRQKKALVTTIQVPILNLIALPVSVSLPLVPSILRLGESSVLPYGDVSVSRYAMWQRFLF